MTSTSVAARATDERPEPLGRRFGFLFGSTSLSNLSDGILAVGVPLLALTLTTSPVLISMLSAAFTLPWLLVSVYAGVRIDRGDRRRIMLLAMTVRTLVLVTGTVAAVTGMLTMPLLLGLLVVFGTAEVFADSSAATLIPAVVPRSRLGAANGRLLGAQQVANAFLGAPLAGVLLAVGAGWVFGVPAALCVGALLCVGLGLRGAYRAPPRARTSLRLEVREGMAFLFTHRVMRPLLISSTVSNLVNAGYFAVFVLWVVGPGSAVGLAPERYGLLLAGLAVGAVAGSLVAERLLRHLTEIRLLTGMWLVNALLLLVPVLWPSAWVIGAAFVLVGFTNTVGNVINVSLRQRLVPDGLLGRVTGASRTLAYGMMPLGALLAGVVGEVFGLPAVFVGAVALSVTFVLYVVCTVTPQMVSDADEAARRRTETDVATDPVIGRERRA